MRSCVVILTHWTRVVIFSGLVSRSRSATYRCLVVRGVLEEAERQK